MTSIEKILQQCGPLMSSELAKRLEAKEKIPINTASQKVSRNKTIEKIKGFYVSNQSFCFLKEHESNGILYDKFVKSLFDYGKKYWYCVNVINLHGGYISRRFLECYTNYPVIPLKKHLPFNTVMQNFINQGILVYNHEVYSFAPRFSTTYTSTIAFTTIEQIKESILSSFNSFTKNIGLISYNTGEFFGEYGKFRWAFKGVSNVSGLIQNNKSGFLLADILIGSSIYENDVSFFIEKIKHIQSFQNASKIIPFLLVDNLDKGALTLLKKHGIVVGFIGELFGQKYAKAINELITVLKNAGASLKKTPDKYLELIKQLKKYNEGLANNIKGALFEYMVGHIHSVSCQTIEIGREIIESNARHEMDILAIYQNKVIISECKATNSQIDLKTINKWIDKKIPAFKLWFDKQEMQKNKKLEFEFWSTRGFTSDALDRLKRYSSSTKKFKVTFLQSYEIKEKAKEMNNKKMKDALDNYFLKTDI